MPTNEIKFDNNRRRYVIGADGNKIYIGDGSGFSFKKSAGRVVVRGKKFIIGERKIKKAKHSPRKSKSVKKSGQKNKRSQRKSH